MEQVHEAQKLTGFSTLLRSSEFGDVNLVFPGRSYSTKPLKGEWSKCCMVSDRFLT
ncbi:hypothetical protein L484_001158 [Morus notabilis]|uniref:Uncharacterized protein n=1 Tax=Morus notabilis TaxID=981085 RepID=W9RQ96_9ROSA|nr:hypothetical protein L484_001158 [Morus notabilis]